jgi:dihydroflavonol-4-reductase
MEDNNRKSISVVTGATGRIGFALCLELKKRGIYVRALCRKNSPLTAKLDFVDEIVYGDLTDIDSLRAAFDGAEYVYNLGGVVSIVTKPGEELAAVNVGGTRNVVDVCLERGVKRLIHTCSVHALHFSDNTSILRELEYYEPEKTKGPYSVSKATGANVILDAVKARGLDAVLALPSGVVGAYEYRLSNIGQMVRDVGRGKLPFYIKGEYDFVDTVDVASALADLSTLGASGESYILSGHKTTVKELLTTVAKHAGVKPPWLFIPFWLARLVAGPMERLYLRRGNLPLLTPYSLQVLHDNCNFSHEKITALTGYSPRSIDEAMKSQVEFNKAVEKENIQ